MTLRLSGEAAQAQLSENADLCSLAGLRGINCGVQLQSLLQSRISIGGKRG
jgi:hypothetical protein